MKQWPNHLSLRFSFGPSRRVGSTNFTRESEGSAFLHRTRVTIVALMLDILLTAVAVKLGHFVSHHSRRLKVIYPSFDVSQL